MKNSSNLFEMFPRSPFPVPFLPDIQAAQAVETFLFEVV